MWYRQRHWRFLQWSSSYWMTMLSVIMHWKHLASFSGGNTWELLRSFFLTFLSSASNKRLLTGKAIDFSEEWTGQMHLFCFEISLQDVIVVLLLSSAPYPSLLTVRMSLSYNAHWLAGATIWGSVSSICGITNACCDYHAVWSSAKVCSLLFHLVLVLDILHLVSVPHMFQT